MSKHCKLCQYNYINYASLFNDSFQTVRSIIELRSRELTLLLKTAIDLFSACLSMYLSVHLSIHASIYLKSFFLVGHDFDKKVWLLVFRKTRIYSSVDTCHVCYTHCCFCMKSLLAGSSTWVNSFALTMQCLESNKQRVNFQ